MQRQSRKKRSQTSRKLSFEILELRRVLSFESLALVQAIETNSSQREFLRFRLGFDQAEWSIPNSTSNRRGIGFGASKDFGGQAGSLGTVNSFLNDTPLAGDWAGLGKSNIGTARWQESILDRTKLTWNFTLATDRDEHVDLAYNFPATFDPVSSEALLPIPLAGDFDGQNGDDLAIVDIPSGSEVMRWRIATESAEPSIAYPELRSSIQEVFFGPRTASPVAGYYRVVGGVRQAGIATVSLTGSTATWSVLYPNGQGIYTTAGETQRISQQLSVEIASGNWRPIVGDFDNNGEANLGIVEWRTATGTGQLLLHIAGLNSPLVLANNARVSDRIIVGDWAQSQWSSNKCYTCLVNGNAPAPPISLEHQWGLVKIGEEVTNH